jgi:hypothetical protein
MRGIYRVFLDGKLAGESENLITDAGRMAILRYLAGEIPSWAGAMSIGSHTTAAAREDTKLAFEFARDDVTLLAANLVTNRIIAKSTFDRDVAGKIWELGLYTAMENAETSELDKMLSKFDVDEELFSLTGNVVSSTTQSRAGERALLFTPAASGTATALLTDFFLDLSEFQNTDTLSIAYHNSNATTPSVRVRLYNDASNYYTYTFTTSASGYYVRDFARSNFVATGAPTWDGIEYADFMVTAAGGGAAGITLDGFRINDRDPYVNYALVSRSVRGTAITKRVGQELDIEYEVQFTI